MEDLKLNEIKETLRDMDEECLVFVDSDYEVGLHNYGDDYYKAGAEFSELAEMSDEELEEQDIIACVYMSGYEVCDTLVASEDNSEVIDKIIELCEKVGEELKGDEDNE